MDEPAATGSVAVAVRKAVKTYGSAAEPVRALDEVSLELSRGRMVALVGPSGCGKSTLLNLIGCVDLPTSGTIEIGGRVTSALTDDELTALRRDHVGTVFQAFNLIGSLTLAENVAVPLLLAGLKQRDVDLAVRAALETVGIADRASALPSQASGGQQQRAAIARAIVRRPTIVLADEPTGSLDSQNGELVMRLLRSLADGGQTILLATHSREAAAVCDGIMTMHDGKLLAAAAA